MVADPAEVDDQIREVVEQHLDPEKRKADTHAEIGDEGETSAASGV